MIGIAMVLLAMYQGIPPLTSEVEPLRNKVRVELSSARDTYSVGETVRLLLTLRNFSDTQVLGAFTLESAAKKNVYYRHGAGDFKELTHLMVRGFPVENIVRLDPDATLTHDFGAAFNPTTQRPLLDEPGDYEFFREVYGQRRPERPS